MFNCQLWNSNHVGSNFFTGSEFLINKTGLFVRFVWHGHFYKNLVIDVDVVPVLDPSSGYWPKVALQESSVLQRVADRKCLFTLVTSRRSSAVYDSSLRPSFSVLEREIFETLSPTVKDAYVAAKVLRLVCPTIVSLKLPAFENKWVDKRAFYASSVLCSYWLKNIVFYELEKQALEGETCAVREDFSTTQWVIKIYLRLHDFICEQEKLPSFFIPNFDLLKKEINKLQDEDLTVNEYINASKLACKLILSMLNEAPEQDLLKTTIQERLLVYEKSHNDEYKPKMRFEYGEDFFTLKSAVRESMRNLPPVVHISERFKHGSFKLEMSEDGHVIQLTLYPPDINPDCTTEINQETNNTKSILRDDDEQRPESRWDDCGEPRPKLRKLQTDDQPIENESIPQVKESPDQSLSSDTKASGSEDITTLGSKTENMEYSLFDKPFTFGLQDAVRDYLTPRKPGYFQTFMETQSSEHHLPGNVHEMEPLSLCTGKVNDTDQDTLDQEREDFLKVTLDTDIPKVTEIEEEMNNERTQFTESGKQSDVHISGCPKIENYVNIGTIEGEEIYLDPATHESIEVPYHSQSSEEMLQDISMLDEAERKVEKKDVTGSLDVAGQNAPPVLNIPESTTESSSLVDTEANHSIGGDQGFLNQDQSNRGDESSLNPDQSDGDNEGSLDCLTMSFLNNSDYLTALYQRLEELECTDVSLQKILSG